MSGNQGEEKKTSNNRCITVNRLLKILFRETGKRGQKERTRGETTRRDNAKRTDKNAFRTDKYSWQASKCSLKEVVMHTKIHLHLEGHCSSCQFTVQVLKLF